MKKYFMTLLLAGLVITGFQTAAQTEDKSKRPSPPATASGTIGGVHVLINYSSPSVRGRKVFGGMENYGSVWRAGANEATTIDFDKDVTIQGKPLSKGKYAFYVLLTSPAKWTLIFNKKWDQWGTNYEENKAEDVLKVEADTKTIASHEKLSYKVNSDGVSLLWETKEVDFKVAQR